MKNNTGARTQFDESTPLSILSIENVGVPPRVQKYCVHDYNGISYIGNIANSGLGILSL